jgi:hypothetical protein
MKSKKSWVAVTGLAIGILAAVAIIQFRKNGEPGGVDVLSPSIDTQVELARTALAATENLDSPSAETAWSELFRQMPKDRSVSINRALNRVLLVDSLTEATTNALLNAEEKQAARRQLPPAIDQARQAIADFGVAGDDKVTMLWLASRIDLQEASLLPASVAKSLRREIFDRLSKAIEVEFKDDPRGIILGGPLIRVLDDLESPINGLPPEIQDRAAKVLAALSEQHPDNLFVALRSARLNIAAKSSRAVDAVRRTEVLASAIEPSLSVQTQSIGLSPADLVKKIIDAIEKEDWQAADNQMLLWFNVLNSTDLVKTDRRRTSPHPLDRLNFEVLRELSAAVAQQRPIAAGTNELRFKEGPIGDESDVALALPIDFDLDLDLDVAVVTKSGAVSIWGNETEGNWKLAGRMELGLEVEGAFAADLFMVDASDSQRLQASPNRESADAESAAPAARHNTFLSLLVYGAGGARLVVLDGRAATADSDRLAIPVKPTGLEDVVEVTTAIAGDLEGDGDLDLAFATRNLGLRIFVNRGNRTFYEASGSKTKDELERQKDIAAMAIVDLDRDLDLDVVTVDKKTGQVGLIENLLHLQFRFRNIDEIPLVEGANEVVIADIDGNVSWDILVGGGKETRIAYSQTADAGAWVVDRTELIAKSQGAFLLADFDNDSWSEFLSENERRAHVKRLVGNQIQSLSDVDIDMSGPSVISADVNGDGKPDVLAVSEGKTHLYLNATEAPGHYFNVRFRGIDDNNANSGRVNHYAIGSVVELRFGPHYRANIITTPATHFGMDGFDKAASLRVIFPNGLTQTLREPAVDALVEEEQTLKGSCPYLYAWDGEKYAFVTDCLWAAPLGLQVAAGVVAKDRPWEYLKVDGDHVKSHDGMYDMRITEELWEVAYFDHVTLTAVDHPQDVEVWTNEKVGPAEIAQPNIYAFQPENLRPIKNAIDTRGRDVTKELSSIDQTFVKGFDRRIRQGLCPPHWVDLDFGAMPESETDAASVFLVLTGWILPTDTSLNIQIDQNPEIPSIEFPSVWVPDATQPDGWRNAIPFMGFPGGKTKTIVVDVTQVMNKADPRFRIRTSAQIYWDRAQIAVQSSAPHVVSQELELVNAELQYHGFSKRVQFSSNAPETYDYSQATVSPKWPPLQDRFSKYGECKDLVDRWDDSMVVMGSGDELRLQFAATLDPPPAGWKRDFVLHCVGWDKDADLNTLTGQSSMPLPFREMTGYPPTQSQATERDQALQQNLFHLQRSQPFRKFWHR